MTRTGWTIAVASLLTPGAATVLPAQDTVVEGQLEVIEVGVLADLPSALRGRDARALGERLEIVEGGVVRPAVSVSALGGSGTDAYGRVLVVFDLERCSPEVLRLAPAALGGEAERLAALGPVTIATYAGGVERYAEPARSAAATAQALARAAGELQCAAAPEADHPPAIELDDQAIACPARPCLMAWIGAGWGPVAEGEDEAARTSAVRGVEPLARRLAGRGWTLLAAPIDRADSAAPRRSAPEPRYQAESGTYRFGINVLDRRRDKAPMSAEEYSKYVDLWLAPLRRLAAATAGELVTTGDALAPALESLASRSILYYRSERKADGEAPTLLVREPGEAGRTYRTAEWAPMRDH